MNENHRKTIDALRKMADEEAATWLKNHYPGDDRGFLEGVFLMSHRPWKKKQRDELAEYYLGFLEKYAVPSSKFFNELVLVMPIWKLCQILSRHLPTDISDLDLFAYNGLPVLQYSCQTDKDHEAVKQLENKVRTQLAS